MTVQSLSKNMINLFDGQIKEVLVVTSVHLCTYVMQLTTYLLHLLDFQ